MPRSVEEWRLLAANRVLKILRTYRLCSLRQLESKVSEAGPADMRPEPLLISDALKSLESSHRIKVIKIPGIKVPFYGVPSFDMSNPHDEARYSFISTVYPKYREIAEKDEFCGTILETIMFQAALSARRQTVIGTPEKKAQNITINNISVKNQPPVDLLLFDPSTELFIGVEAKNWREWIYPHDEVIRKFLRKCLADKLAPVFITVLLKQC